MKFKITGGYLELEPMGTTIKDISDKLKKIASSEAKAEEKKTVEAIFKPSGEITIGNRKGIKDHLI